MAIGNRIEYADLEDLYLDPDNPRLGREFTHQEKRQSAILEVMKDWALEELAVSFMESGFWPHEAVLAIEQPLYGKKRLVVVEGNRRIAALMLLKRAEEGRPESKKWAEIAKSAPVPPKLFEEIPFIRVGSRKDADAFLGFRHVTGIKEWQPAEKAEFIAHLVEDQGLSYDEVMRRIGSKTATVRQNYISYRLLLQMEGTEQIAAEKVEARFSVLYLSLRSAGVQQYLDIDIMADPRSARRPVPKSKLEALARFALWLFGSDDVEPIVTDSRQVDRFGVALGNAKAVAYLERTERPSLQVAFRLAGGDEEEVVESVEKAADLVESALSRAHAYRSSIKLRTAVERLAEDTDQLVKVFPAIAQKLNRLGP
ncbi:MAG: hypothetical protein WA891_11260 [Acidobacteriaceae bacterium]